MGIVIDKTKTKYGKCRPYLLIMPIIIGISTISLFINKIYSEQNSAFQNTFIIITAAFSIFLWNILFTAGDAPLTALPSVMTSNANKKSKLISYFMVAATLGSGAVSLFFIPFAQWLTISFLPPDNAISSQKGFFVAVLIFTILATVFYQLAGLFTKERIVGTVSSRSLKQSFAIIKNNRPYKLLILSGILRAPADTVMTSLTMIIIYYYGNNGNTPYLIYMITFLLSMGLGQITSTLFAPLIIRRFEKKNVFIFSLLILCTATALIFCLYLGLSTLTTIKAIIFIAFLLFLIGSAIGILNVTQSNMVADTVDLSEYDTGFRPDGVFFSVLSMINKFSVGITALITGGVFAIVGFSGDGVRAVNELLNSGAVFATDPFFSKYRFAMFFLMCIPPIIGFVLSAIPLFYYKLTNNAHLEIVKALVIRKNQNNKDK